MNSIGKYIFDKSTLSDGYYKIKTNWGGYLNLHPFYFLDRQVITTGCYDSELHNFLRSYIKPDMIVFDVGANIGEITLHLSLLVGEMGKVWAFEPAPLIRSRLINNLNLNSFSSNVAVRSEALSDVNGDAKFAIADIGIENQGMGSLVNTDNGVVSQEITVKTIKLDDFIFENDIESIDFIKVDIQGGEPYFLRGAQKTLEKIGPDLVLEISSTDLACVNKTPNDLISELKNCGYRIFTFDGKNISLTEVDKVADGEDIGINVFCTKKLMQVRI